MLAALSCGDNEAPPTQAVLWLGLSPSQGSTCSSSRVFQVPETAQSTITSTDGRGDRVLDRGADSVECTMTPAAEAGSYDVTLRYAENGGEIGELRIIGRLHETNGGELQLDFQTSSFALSSRNSDPCTAQVNRLVPQGALWIDSLNCPRLIDPSSPAIGCVASGGLIFENCR